ncbi:MAG: cobalt ECF transporter T component CbiQ [Candidatus Hydrogenedentota bacterium]
MVWRTQEIVIEVEGSWSRLHDVEPDSPHLPMVDQQEPSPSLNGSFHALDPRVRVVAAFVLSFTAVLAPAWAGVAVVTAFALGLFTLGRCWAVVYRPWRRLAAANLFAAMLLAILPWSVSGHAVFSWGPWSYSLEGARDAAIIALRANTAVLLLMALLGTLTLPALCAALSHLGMPRRLALLTFLTVRYLAVFEQEIQRMRRTLRVRCFEARFNLHTLRVTGVLVGNLLMRGFERSERVLAAMKCRGFQGRFPWPEHARLQRWDWGFAAIGCAWTTIAWWVAL